MPSGDIVENATGSGSTGPRIVLGIDYGTTYTGLAWMQTDGNDTPSLKDLHVYRHWPERDAPKVPSLISYSRTSAARRCRQWGYSIDDHSQVMQWTKLELESRPVVRELEILRELMKGLAVVDNFRVNRDAGRNNEIPQHLAKDVGDIVEDYLSKVAREWYNHMRGIGLHTLSNVPVDIVITHPAAWSYEAMNKTFRAVVGAFHKGMFPTIRDISFSSEPEACALFTVQDMLLKERNSLIPGECFVVCDAGGGTVDLVSYRIESIEPLRITRVGSVTGEKYGAIFIDQAFLSWLEERVEDLDMRPKEYGTGGHYILEPKGRVMLERFERIKHAFSGKETSNNITLPRRVVVSGDQKQAASTGVLDLTRDDMIGLFSRSVGGTVELIAKQVTLVEMAVKGTRSEVSNIFLSGGFSENPYLFNEVKDYADSTGHINVERASDCWSGVVGGAVLRGMAIGMDAPPKVKSCPRHYGICVSQIYADWRHTSETTVRDKFHGKAVVPQQLIWLVRKGDLILPDAPVEASFTVNCRFTRANIDKGESARVVFVATALDDPPSSFSDLPKDQEIVNLDVDPTSIPIGSFRKRKNSEGKNYFTADVKVEIQISRRGLKLRTKFDGKTLKSHDNMNL